MPQYGDDLLPTIYVVLGTALLGWAIMALTGRKVPPVWVALVCTVLTWGFLGYEVYQREYQSPKADAADADADWNKPLKQIFRKTFRNETVFLDGYEFVECEFHDVTFDYEGRQPFRLIDPKFTHDKATPEFLFKFNSDNRAVGMVQNFFMQMGVFHGQ